MATRLGLIAGWVLLLAAPAWAQQLQRLHVTSVTLRASTAHPRINVPFNVVLTIRVKENARLQNVFLPSFVGPQELGDVREQFSRANGSLYRETIALVALAPGALHISPGSLEAVDARDGIAKRFSSNALDLTLPSRQVSGTRWPVRALAWSAAALVAALFVVQALRSRRAQRVGPAKALIRYAPLPPIESPADAVACALEVLNVQRTRAGVARARAQLRNLAGARPTQTLADVLCSPFAADPAARSVMIALEHARFVDDAGLAVAIAAVLRARPVNAA